MRLSSSFLPKAAIEVAVCSKYSLEAIDPVLEKIAVKSDLPLFVSPREAAHFCDKFCGAL